MKTPPAFLVALLRWSLPRGVKGESILGDLREEFELRPTRWRNVWYAKHVVLLALEYRMVRRASGLWRSLRIFVRRPRRESLVWFDIRHAVRVFRKTPSVTVLSIATLALGIGATTAIFSVVDAVLLRSLPYERPSELVTVWNTYPSWRGHEVLDPYWDRITLSYPEYEDWRDGQRSFQSVAIYGSDRATITELGDPFQANVGLASSTLFPLLGVRPLRGRTFLPHEEGERAHLVAVLGHELWLTHFGEDPEVVGRTIVLDGKSFTIVGVLPSRFSLRSLDPFAADIRHDLWIPIGANGADLDRGNHNYEAIGRMIPGVTMEQAAADIGPLLRGPRGTSAQDLRILSRKDEEVGAARGQLILLFVSVGVLMLIACANVATLLLASAANRRDEFATRAALGAGGLRLARQLLTESVLLGVVGAASGIAIAILGSRVLLSLAPAGLWLPPSVSLDFRVLGFAAALGIFTGILFGVAPTLFTLKTQKRLTAYRRTVAGDAPAWFSQRAVVALQLALSLVLVTSAGLLSRSLLHMLRVDPGFRTNNVTIARLSLTGDRYQQLGTVIQFVREVTAELRAMPGVADVSLASAVPFSGAGGSSSFQIVGREVPSGEKLPEAHRRSVLHNFHELLNIPILAGRSFDQTDVDGSKRVVLVSAAMAERYWPGASPLGARIVRDRREWEIIGVVGDVLHAELTGQEESTYYFPFYQQPSRNVMFLIVSEPELTGLATGLRRVIWTIDPALPVPSPEGLGPLVRASTADARFRTVIVAAFGICALVLSVVGVYGVTSRSVSSRTRELGIRVALGAHTMRLMRTIVFREVGAVAAGIVVGTVVALVVARALSAFLFRVQSYDPVTFVGSVVVLLMVGIAAACLPARRAARIDPVDVLRAD